MLALRAGALGVAFPQTRHGGIIAAPGREDAR